MRRLRGTPLLSRGVGYGGGPVTTAMFAGALLILDDAESDDERVYDLLMQRRIMQIRTRHDPDKQCVPPPQESASMYLLRTASDVAYISRLGIPVAAFHRLLRQFHHLVPRRRAGWPGRPPSITPAQALALVLEFYSSTGELKTLGALYGLTSRRASTWLERAEVALYTVLQRERLARICWPSFETQRIWGSHMAAHFPLVPNRFGYVDGKNLHVQEPSDVDLQNAMYNGWLHCVFVTGVLCFGCDGTLIWAKHNVVGSWNDGEVAGKLFIKLLDPALTLPEYGMVSDSAFPSSKALFKSIVTPLKEGELDGIPAALQHFCGQVSAEITSMRQTCEWGMGAIQKPFRRLTMPLPYDYNVRHRRLCNLFRLWNVRVRSTGITQVANTFDVPIYQ